MAKKLSSKGMMPLAMVAAALVIVALTASGWYLWQTNHEKTKSTAQTTAKPQTTPTTQADPYAGRQSYTSQKYGFSLKYPTGWKYDEVAIASPSGLDPQEFALNLKVDNTEKYNDTAALEGHVNPIATVSKFYDDYYAQSALNKVDKRAGTLKGKSAVTYDVTNSGVQSKLYLFDLGSKTYAFHSINEELNQQRSSDYWTDFDKVFESLTIK